MYRPRPSPGRSFTLIELLTVVAIISLLAAVAIPLFANARFEASLSTSLQHMRNIETAVNAKGFGSTEFSPADRADSLLTDGPSPGLVSGLDPDLAASLLTGTLTSEEADALRREGIRELLYTDGSGARVATPVAAGLGYAYRTRTVRHPTAQPDGSFTWADVDARVIVLGLPAEALVFDNPQMNVELAHQTSPFAAGGTYGSYLLGYDLGTDADADGSLSPGETITQASFAGVYDYAGRGSIVLAAAPNHR